jgi:hypothetical protein
MMVFTARLRLTLVLAVAALTLLSATSLTAQDVLTNDSVISMKKAGLSDSLILAKIRSSASKFDTSTKGLIALKIAGGSYAPYGGSSYKYGVRSEDKIDLEPAEKDARGYYRLTPKEPLKPGEYGFVVTYGSTGAGQVFDFGVD